MTHIGIQGFGAGGSQKDAAKDHKSGFVVSRSNLKPDQTLNDVLRLKEANGYSTVAVTDDGSATGKLLGIVTSRDYRVSRMSGDEKISTFMTPLDKLVYAKEGVSLQLSKFKFLKDDEKELVSCTKTVGQSKIELAPIPVKFLKPSQSLPKIPCSDFVFFKSCFREVISIISFSW